MSLVHTYCMCLPLQDGFLNPTCSQVRWEGVRCSARQLVESSLSCHHVSQEHLCYKHYKGLFQNICPGLQLSPEGSVSSGISIQTKVRSAERDGNLSLHIYVVRCSHLPISTVTFPAVCPLVMLELPLCGTQESLREANIEAKPQPESCPLRTRPDRPLRGSRAQCHSLRTQ